MKYVDISDLKVAFISCDHAASLVKASANNFEDSILLACYYHMMKAMKAVFTKAREGAYWQQHASTDLYMLHICHSVEIFKALSVWVLLKWRASGHASMAVHLAKVYMGPDWCRWYCGSHPRPGICLTNNPLEAFNKTIKNVIKKDMRSTMDSFLSALPALHTRCMYLYTKVTSTAYSQAQAVNSCSFTASFWQRVKQLYQPSVPSFLNVCKHTDGSYYVNSQSTVCKASVSVERILGHNDDTFNITAGLVAESIVLGQDTESEEEEEEQKQEEEEEKEDEEVEELNWASIPGMPAGALESAEFYETKIGLFKRKYMTLHQVTPDDVENPTSFTCDCKNFWHNGTLCIHIAAVMHMSEVRSMADKEPLQINRKRGRPKGAGSSVRV